MSINIKLEVFEGPFELLYHLIEKAKIDIYDIPIAEITEQYIDYLNAMKYMDIDLASEFLVMAATLLEIKSKMLLPKTLKSEDDDIEDPRDELVLKLLEYKKFKNISNLLKERYFLNEKSLYKDTDLADAIVDSFELPDQLPIDLLVEKFKDVLLNKREYEKSEYKRVFRDNITIEGKINEILGVFSSANSAYFDDLLIYCEDKLEIIVTFLALLELIKRKDIYAEQVSNFNKILIKKASI